MIIILTTKLFIIVYNKMEDIFNENDWVITSFIVPWILEIGCKTPDEAKRYIKRGETLNPYYYCYNNKDIEENGIVSVYSRFMTRLFDKNNIDNQLTKIIGENVYKPWDCLSGIFKININDKLGLVARPNGVTKNNDCIIIVDDYITKLYNNTEEEINIKLLSTMAVWKANKGIYIIKRMNKNISIEFDNNKWNDILNKIKIWANKINNI